MPYSGLRIRKFGEEWKLHSRSGCAGGESRMFFDESLALGWLRSFKSDSGAMHNLRSLAAQHPSPLHVSRFDDESVLRLIAPLLSNGSLHAHRILRATGQGRNAQDVSGPAPRVASTVRPSRSIESVRPAASKPETAEADAFSATTDTRATAAALRQASASGASLCKECSRAATASR